MDVVRAASCNRPSWHHTSLQRADSREQIASALSDCVARTPRSVPSCTRTVTFPQTGNCPVTYSCLVSTNGPIKLAPGQKEGGMQRMPNELRFSARTGPSDWSKWFYGSPSCFWSNAASITMFLWANAVHIRPVELLFTVLGLVSIHMLSNGPVTNFIRENFPLSDVCFWSLWITHLKNSSLTDRSSRSAGFCEQGSHIQLICAWSNIYIIYLFNSFTFSYRKRSFLFLHIWQIKSVTL